MARIESIDSGLFKGLKQWLETVDSSLTLKGFVAAADTAPAATFNDAYIPKEAGTYTNFLDSGSNAIVIPTDYSNWLIVGDGTNWFKKESRINASTILSLGNYSIDGLVLTIISTFSFVYRLYAGGTNNRYQITPGTYAFSGGNQALVVDLSQSTPLVPYIYSGNIYSISNDNIVIIAITNSDGKISLVNDGLVSSKLMTLQFAQGNNLIEFSDSGYYDATGSIIAGSGFNKIISITEPGLYRVGWSLGGSVRKILAIDASNNIIQTYENGANAFNFLIDIPIGTVNLLASSYGTPRDGYLTKVDKSTADSYGLIKESRVSEITRSEAVNEFNYSDEPDFIDIYGNPWSDGLWKNPTINNTITRIYTVNDVDEFDLFYDPDTSISYQMALSSKDINAQLAANEDFGGITYNGTVLNCLGNDYDTNTVNGYTVTRKTISRFVFPSGTKRFILVLQVSGSAKSGIRLYKRRGAKGIFSEKDIANKSIAVCGDSVSQNPQSEIGKELLRNYLGCRVDTFGIGGAGWSINATPTWVTPQNVSGLYQVEELVKAGSMTYDIYLLSCTLNDPITHNKDIGGYNYCKPYLTDGSGNPDLTDPNLDTMLGALNYSIQRIYEKNPSAKIVIGTMNKCFLLTSKNGFSTAAGYDPLDTSLNPFGHTYYEYVQAVRKLGEVWGIPVVEVYGNSGINEFNNGIMMVDEYHPTEEGYKKIWKQWFDVVIKA